MRLKIKILGRDIKIFARLWWDFVFWRAYRGFSQFEKVKQWIAHLLYRQRGRFARPFTHTAMAGLAAMGITLAPVLANSLPATTISEEVLPGSQVMEIVSDDTTTIVPADRVRDRVLEYEVKSGDTVGGIAEKFGISADTVRWENNLILAGNIKPGQALKILPVSGIRHKVARGETIFSIAKKYNAYAQAVVDFPFNTFMDNETFALSVGQDLIVPDGEKPNVIPQSPTRYVAQRTPDAGAVSATGSWAWPIGGVITQRFAWYHTGVDIATALGTSVIAADSGRIIVAGWPDNSGYGNRVVIDHGNGYQSLYAHLSRVDVVVGQTVARGAQIGLEGSTGRSTGPHLHFEIRKSGSRLNPLQFLR